jgi:hypothetical protein
LGGGVNKEEYAVREGRAVATCPRGGMRSACVKRVETKERVVVRGTVKIECKGKAKEEGECLVWHEVCEVSL